MWIHTFLIIFQISLQQNLEKFWWYPLCWQIPTSFPFFSDRNFGRINSWLPRLLPTFWKVAKKCNCKIFIYSKICLIFDFSFLIWSVEKRYFNQSYCEKCEENMSLEQPPFHSHFQEGHFATSFTALDQLRKEDVLTDITLVAAENLSCLPVRTVRAHKLVLMAVSDYFRTMFKGEYSYVAWSLFLDQRCHLTKFLGVL